MQRQFTYSVQESIDFAKEFVASIKKGGVIILQGELGAGKTQFVKGLAKGLGVKENILSPTFVIMNIYKIKNNKYLNKLVHVDAYRLSSEEELLDIGIDEFLDDPNALVVIEWGNKVKKILKKYSPMIIKMEFGDVQDERNILMI